MRHIHSCLEIRTAEEQLAGVGRPSQEGAAEAGFVAESHEGLAHSSVLGQSDPEVAVECLAGLEHTEEVVLERQIAAAG